MSATKSATNDRMNSDAPNAKSVSVRTALPQWWPAGVAWRRTAVYAALAVVVFAFGLIPMWIKANQYAGERDTAQHELRLKQMESLLAAAVIYAARGDYEPARQMSSDFFTSARAQIDRGTESDLSPGQREKLGALLAQRDEVITLLARSDPSAVQRLSDAYVAYRQTMNDVAGTGVTAASV